MSGQVRNMPCQVRNMSGHDRNLSGQVRCMSGQVISSDVEAEAVGSGLFQRKQKRKGSFQIFASLPEAEAVFGLTEITMQITDELRMPLHWSTEGGTIFS